MLRSLVQLANKLFIDICKEFTLEYINGHYCLKNPFEPSCHLLELALISSQKMTGNKIQDLKKVLDVNERWILGFYHGFKELNCKYLSYDYRMGHFLGQKMTKIVSDNQKKVPI